MRVEQINIFSQPFDIDSDMRTQQPGARSGYLVQLRLSSGEAGWGEIVTWPGFGDGPAAVESFIQSNRWSRLQREHCDTVEQLQAILSMWPNEIAFGFESAWLDAVGKQRGCAVAELFGRASTQRVVVRGLYRAGMAMDQLKQAGIVCLKLKAPQHEGGWVDDAEHCIDAGFDIWLDANGTWTRDFAEKIAQRLPLGRIVAIEQPFLSNDLEAHAWLRRLLPISIALDESVQSLTALEQAVAAEALDLAVIKPAFNGGIATSLQIADRCRTAALDCVITHGMNATIGRIAALQVAAMLPGGLPHGLLRSGLPSNASEPKCSAGRLEVPAGPGMGITDVRIPEVAAAS